MASTAFRAVITTFRATLGATFRAMPAAEATAAAAETAAEALTFFRRHLFPALARMMPRMAPPAMAMTMRSQATEQEPGEHEQPQRFPVIDHRPTEERRHEPVPQAHDHEAHHAEHDGD